MLTYIVAVAAVCFTVSGVLGWLFSHGDAYTIPWAERLAAGLLMFVLWMLMDLIEATGTP